MRLRRETGDFQIRINPSNGTNAIRTGLSAEDFAGELININGTIEPVLSVSESEGIVTAKTASYTVTYNKETGAVTSSEGGAGGSGDGASGTVITMVPFTEERYDGELYYTAPDLTIEALEAIATSHKQVTIRIPAGSYGIETYSQGERTSDLDYTLNVDSDEVLAGFNLSENGTRQSWCFLGGPIEYGWNFRDSYGAAMVTRFRSEYINDPSNPVYPFVFARKIATISNDVA